MRLMVFIFMFFATFSSFAQKKAASVSGKIIDENEDPVGNVTITILGKQDGILASDSGTFRIKVSSGKAFALVFSHTGFNDEQTNFYLSDGEEENVTVKLTRSSKTMDTVTVNGDKDRQETGLIKMNPKSAMTLPSATGGVEGLIKTLVGSNNELTSQYSVRGGNYEENLIYINDFEIYRPYLVNSGQQEGLSFINPELVKNISFYTGGFQAKYGDKMSSVLDIQYKKPVSFGGSVYVSLLEQGISLEGTSKNQKLSVVFGARSKTNRNLLSSQETKGVYIPSAADLQTYLIYKFSQKLQLEVLGILSGSKFSFFPESAQKSSAVFSPLYTANIGLDVFFQGQEKDKYNNGILGLSLVQTVNEKMKLRWMVSYYDDIEDENSDITGTYILGERNVDKNQPDFGMITNPLGAGSYQYYVRNHLNILDYNISQKGTYRLGNHFLQWGVSFDHTIINDRLNEWEFQDSAGYSLPYNPNVLNLSQVLKSTRDLNINKYSGYLQDNILLSHGPNDVTLQAGVRFNYNALNKEFIISPRAQVSYKPAWKKDVIFKASAGVYDQPPFYLEMLRPDGSVNTALKSQKSIQFVAGFNYNLSQGGRPVYITTEAYYKSLTDVDPYDIDNVHIQYFGENNAKAFATGIESRLFTELVKGAESWFSIGISKTMENIDNDYYYNYKNAAGEIINSGTPDKVVADSVRTDVGWVRRPTDRLITMGLFLQDYLSTNKNFKVHLNLIYGSNMPFNIPNNPKYRNALIIDPYIRADIGFSALLLSEKSLRRSHSPFRSFENIWASLEIFNLLDRANTISYQLVKDYANDVYAIPNRLTPRLVNFKLLARF
ncbi:MAG TPA: carboxypeptidase-like regulatory domain-containing protein [Hanamia sp.]